MKRLILLISLSTVYCLGHLPAQDTSFIPSNFPGRETEMKNALKAFTNGSKELDKEEPDYIYALRELQKAYLFNPSNSELNNRLGECYLNLGDASSALGCFNKSIELAPDQGPGIHYKLARSHQLLLEADLAIRKYNDYLNMLPASKLRTDSVRVNQLIKQSLYAKHLALTDTRVYVDRLEFPVNSSLNDHLVFSDHSDSLIIISTNRGQPGKKKPSGDKVLLVTRSEDDRPIIAHPVRKLQKNSYDSYIAWLAPDGSSFMAGRSNKPGVLLKYEFKDGKWSYMGKEDRWGSYPGAVNSLSFNPESTLVAMSVRTEDYGFDIYFSKYNGETWSVPEPAGSALNTGNDETSVCFHPFEQKLFFVSDGHQGIGSTDIFSSEWNGQSWGKPENLGLPVNSPAHESSVSFAGNGRVAYISSDRPWGAGGSDIYRVTFMGEEKQPVMITVEPERSEIYETDLRDLAAGPLIVEPDEHFLQHVVLLFSDTFHPGAKIDVIVSDLPKPVSFKVSTNAPTASFDLPVGRNYTLFPYSSTLFCRPVYFDLLNAVSSDTIIIPCNLVPITSGKSIALPTIRFYPDSMAMLPESETTALWLGNFLRAHPECVFEIQSHVSGSEFPDAGKAIELSSLRASELVVWLVERCGVTPDQVTSNGYGFDLLPPSGLLQDRIEVRCVGERE